MAAELQKVHTQPPAFATERRDAWWLQPLFVVLVLGGFSVYAFWAAFQNDHFRFGNYLSPFYSPEIHVPGWPFSPAFLILWAPLGFRATCYYYRKAYFRSFFADPPACAVGEPRKRYYGETRFPWVLNNLHRFFLYLAILVLGVLWYDTILGFVFDGSPGVGVGSLVMLANVVLLSAYTLGCHSLRHLVGGKADCFSCPGGIGVRHTLWSRVTVLNERHMLWAWLSLFSVALTDLYIRLVSMGVIDDARLI